MQANTTNRNIKRQGNKYLKEMAKKYDVLFAQIKEDNIKSLRLAKFFNFKEVKREDGIISLERKLWEKH